MGAAQELECSSTAGAAARGMWGAVAKEETSMSNDDSMVAALSWMASGSGGSPLEQSQQNILPRGGVHTKCCKKLHTTPNTGRVQPVSFRVVLHK